MFDKLIESEPAGAEFKNRRGYFMVSTVVVGILFLTAVVISIYAQDFGLGSERFELEAMLAPVEMAASAPEPPKPRPLSSLPVSSKTTVPIRTDNIARTDEPTHVPNGTSVERTNLISRPSGDFTIGSTNIDPPGTARTADMDGTSGGQGTLASSIRLGNESDADVKPPPARPITPPKPRAPQSLGVVNSIAISLPKPSYPATAIAMGAQGSVTVQVTIDEAGKVMAANAVNGNPLLRNAAEQAARNARFTPTLLSRVPVKVTGMIIYNFSR